MKTKPAFQPIPGTVVVNCETGMKGVIVPNYPGILDACSEEEVVVAYDDIQDALTTDCRQLKYRGRRNTTLDIRNPERCTGCIFTGVNKCHRYDKKRHKCITSTAGQHPTAPFPKCQLQISAA